MLINWRTIIPMDTDLYNFTLNIKASHILASFDDLKNQKQYRIEAKEILGVRINNQHHCQRLGNAFIQEDSDWILKYVSEPLCTTDMSGCKHYVFDAHDVILELLCLKELQITEYELTVEQDGL